MCFRMLARHPSDSGTILGNYDIAGANGYESLLGSNDVALLDGTKSYGTADASSWPT